MKKALTLILLSCLLIMQSCVFYGKKDALSLATTIKQKTKLDSALTSVNVSNNVVTIHGAGFSNVTTVKMTGTSLNYDLKIDSKSDSQIIASATSALSLLVGETFNLIIGTADAQVTYTVTFTLQNGAIQLSHLSSLGATTAGQILKFNGTSWAPAFFAASQNYLGTWNATTYLPDITTLGSFNPGDYYIVDTAGTYPSSVLTTNPTTFAVGNWVMFNGSTWDKVLNGNLSGSGTVNFIPYYSSSNVLANSPMSVSGSSIGIGTAIPGSSLDIKGTLRLSGATSGFVGIAPAAVAGGTTYTLPAADGTNGQVLTTDASGVLSWTSVSVSGGTVTGVTSANADIGVASGTTAPVLTLNSGTSADQIVKLTAAAKLPAVDGSLLTNLTSTNLVGAVAVANGGTGAITLGASQSALGITLAGPLTGNVPALGATVIADRLCASDSSGGTISCINNLPAATVRGSVLGTSGTGNLLFATSPTISSPVITNIAPATDFTLTQNSVVPFTSVNTGAVANTLYLSAGKVGIGTTTPTAALEILGPSSSLPAPLALKVVGGNTTGGSGTYAGGGISLAAGKGTSVFTGYGSTLDLTGGQYGGIGGYVSINGGNGGNGQPGGNVALTAGAATGAGGSVIVGGGINLGSGNGTGGAITINPGVKAGSGVDGNIVLANLRGNVGIGTTSPTAPLTVKPTADAVTILSAKNSSNQEILKFANTSSGTQAGTLALLTGAGTTIAQLNANYAGSAVIYADGSNTNRPDGAGTLIGAALAIRVPNAVGQENGLFFTNSPSGSFTGASITHYISDTTSYGRGGLKFKTSDAGTPTTRMTIDPTGNVGVGTTAPGAALDVAATGISSAIIVPRATTANRPTTLVNGMIRYNTDLSLFEFYQNGSWVAYTTVSDGRLKTNITPVNQGLNIVNKLKPVFFDWDQNNPRSQGLGTKHQVGFIAQEVEKFLPEVVNKGEDTYRSVEYGKIVSIVVAAVQELYHKLMGHDRQLQAIDRDVASLKDENVAKDRAIASVKAEAKAENAALIKETLALKKENELMKAKLEKIEKLIEKNK